MWLSILEVEGSFGMGTYLSVDESIFQTAQLLILKLYNPSTNIPVLVRLEQSSTSLNTELTMNTSVANESILIYMILVLNPLIYMIRFMKFLMMARMVSAMSNDLMISNLQLVLFLWVVLIMVHLITIPELQKM